jgi:hypothetical protein
MQWNTRRFAILAGVALVSVSLGFSQRMMRMTPQQRVDSLAVQLSLSAEQKAKVLDVFKASDSTRQAAFQEHQGDRDAMRAAMDSIRTSTDAKMKTILTEDQYTKYEKIQADMMSRMRARMRND